jgi:hypothetical protein
LLILQVALRKEDSTQDYLARQAVLDCMSSVLAKGGFNAPVRSVEYKGNVQTSIPIVTDAEGKPVHPARILQVLKNEGLVPEDVADAALDQFARKDLQEVYNIVTKALHELNA